MEFSSFTAGESHGKGIVSVVKGFPSGLEYDKDLIHEDLRRRQGGYGRGSRMDIEQDEVEILSGFYNGKTLGTPITLWVKNRDWKNWRQVVSPEKAGSEGRELNLPRPGHADLAGSLQRGYRDCRKVLERSSARETAGRVAVGGLSKTLLGKFEIKILSRVIRIGGVVDDSKVSISSWSELTENSPVRVIDSGIEDEIIREIDSAKEEGDSLGGVFEVAVTGMPPGLGSYRDPLDRLDSRISSGFMSIPAVKSVEIGLGREVGEKRGSEVHDEIYHDEDRGFYRKTNNAGGIEGGVSNGQAIVVTAAMKPIPTLTKPLNSVNLITGTSESAAKERSDVCAVPAASVVGEAVLANLVLKAFLDKFGGDTMQEINERYKEYIGKLESWFGGD